MIVYLHRVHPGILPVVVKRLKRPSRVVVCHEEPAFPRRFYRGIHAFRSVRTAEIRLFRVKLHPVAVIDRIRKQIVGPVPERMNVILRIKRNETEVTGFRVLPRLVPLVYLNLKAVQRQEILLRQLRVRDEYVVIGEGNDGIALFLIYPPDLLRSFSPVRYRRVTVKVCFVEVPASGKKMLYHD